MPINGGFSFRKCVWSMEKKKLSLPKQIGIALLLGILAGYVFYMLGIPEFTTNYLKPFGTIFVNLLKFIVVPVVLLSMIDGIISMGDMKKVGSVGWKTVAYFLVTTAAAASSAWYSPTSSTMQAGSPRSRWRTARSGIRPPAPTSWIPWSPSSRATCGNPSPTQTCCRSS